MERVKDLDRYQKGILLLLIAMLVIFSVVYFITTSRVGFEYMDSTLYPTEESGTTVYSGVIQGEEASFAVTAGKTVTFTYVNKIYGPYTAKEDPTAVPSDKEFMTGVELRRGDEIVFRGGVFPNGDTLMLFDEDGSIHMGVTITSVGGVVTDWDGNVIDPMEPSVGTILRLMYGPELTSKGEWIAWFCGVFLSIATAVSMLFADELFRWNLAFQIRNVEHAEPSDWEIAGRYIGWTALTIMALVLYIMGLQ